MAQPTSLPATDTASIQQKISDPLRRAIEPLMVRPPTAFDAPVENLKKLLEKPDQLPSGTAQATRESLAALEDAQRRANAGYQERVRENIAKAILGALRTIDPQIPLQLKQAPSATPAAAPAPSASGESGRKKRASTADIEQASAAIRKVLSRDDFLTTGEIQRRSALDADLFRSAMARLKREERIVSNGQRGVGGGWKLA